MHNDKLMQELENRNMNIRQLAIAAGITPQSLYGAVRGRVYFWDGWKQRIASVLNMDVADLFPEEEINE